MTIQLGDTVINTENVFAYEYDEGLRANASTLTLTSNGGSTFRLSGRKANALYDYLEENLSVELDLEEFDDGAIEYDGH